MQPPDALSGSAEASSPVAVPHHARMTPAPGARLQGRVARALALARPTRRRALRDGAILAGLLFLGYLFVVLAPKARTVGLDAYAYWSLDQSDLYGRAQGAVLGAGAFRYSPAIAQLFAPFGQLPWGSFLLLYEALLLGTIVWLGRRRWVPVLAILAFPPVAIELYYGNVHLLLAAAVVLGFRHPWAWAFVLLTKITPGVGLAWFLVRREWRQLAIALGATLGVVAVSWLAAPSLWEEWITTLAGNRTVETTNSIGLPLAVRLPVALLLVAWGARSDRPWTVPVAATFALPVLWIHGLAMLAGAVPFLVERDRRAGAAHAPVGVRPTAEDRPNAPRPGERNSYRPRSIRCSLASRRLRIVTGTHVLGKEVDVVKSLVRRWSADEGQGLAEYALILALIAVVCIVGTAFFGQQVTDTLSFIGKNINDVLP